MSQEKRLAQDILKAAQNSTNHFIANSTANLGDRVTLKHPAGKSISVKALSPLKGNCWIFESGGEWFAYGGAGNKEESSTTIVNRRSRVRSRKGLIFDTAYLFEKQILDGQVYPYEIETYAFNGSACVRSPGSINLDTGIANTVTEAECISNNTFEHEGINYINGGRTLKTGFKGIYTVLTLREEEAHAIYYAESSWYYLTGNYNPDIYLLYRRESGEKLQYAVFYYNLDTKVAAGTIRFQSNVTQTGELYFDADDAPSIANLLRETLGYDAEDGGLSNTLGVRVESNYFSVGGEGVITPFTATITGTAIAADSTVARVIFTGDLPETISLPELIYNEDERNVEAGVGTEAYTLYSIRSPSTFSASDNSTVIEMEIFHSIGLTVENPGKKEIYFQEQDRDPIKLKTLAILEPYDYRFSSNTEEFYVGLKTKSGRASGNFTWGIFDLYTLPFNAPTFFQTTYNYPATIPEPDVWDGFYYQYLSNSELTQIVRFYQFVAEPHFQIASTFPYWNAPNWIFQSLQDYFKYYYNYISDDFTNLYVDENGKIYYFLVSDLIDPEPLHSINNVTGVFIFAGAYAILSRYNSKSLISATLSQNFTNLRGFTVKKLPDEQQISGELLSYSTPVAHQAKLYPLNIGVNVEDNSLAEIEAAINSYDMLGIIPYQTRCVTKKYVDQVITYPTEGVGGD